MGIIPFQSVQPFTQAKEERRSANTLDFTLVKELYGFSEAESSGLSIDEFSKLLLQLGVSRCFGGECCEVPPKEKQASFFRALHLSEWIMAQACAMGKEAAWELFFNAYRQPVLRAALAITRDESLGYEIAESLYGDLYGLRGAKEEAKSLFLSYQGRGSLLGWLRTILAQRYIDYQRKSLRETPLEDLDFPVSTERYPTFSSSAPMLQKAVEKALSFCTAEERFLLVAYYLDEKTLAQIAKVLVVHEATVSRRLKSLMKQLRKKILLLLQEAGLKKQAAEEVMGVDPRDVDVNLKAILQGSQTSSLPKKVCR